MFEPVPQILKNIRYAPGQQPLEQAAVKQVIAAVEQELTGQGRVLVRKSGTEPLIRVMVEADEAERHADRILAVIQEVLKEKAA